MWSTTFWLNGHRLVWLVAFCHCVVSFQGEGRLDLDFFDLGMLSPQSSPYLSISSLVADEAFYSGQVIRDVGIIYAITALFILNMSVKCRLPRLTLTDNVFCVQVREYAFSLLFFMQAYSSEID